jgi:NOL1/NOP2/sun family putative RNA methylase
MKIPPKVSNSVAQILPDEVDEFMYSFEEKTPTSIRWNVKKNDDEKTEERVPWTKSSVYLKSRISFTLDPIFHAGAYYVQEASSMFLEFILDKLPIEKLDLKVLDACASPGGKSTILSSWLANKGILVANEIIKHRANILLENITKWGIGNTMVTSNDPRSFSKLNNVFDVVLVDAPCSGEGMFRKDNAAVLEWSEQQTIACADRQKEILTNLIPTIKNDGYLIYSTCTFNTTENEEIIEWLFETFNFIEVPKLEIDNNWGIVTTKVNGNCCYRFFPHRLKGEGLFYCILQNKSEDYPAKKQQKKNSNLKDTLLQSNYNNWIKESIDYDFFEEKNIIRALPQGMLELKKKLEQHLFILDYGVQVAEVKGKDFNPLHSLAMFVDINKEIFNAIEVSKDEALKFLAKETFAVETKKNGWHLIIYTTYTLGWCKVVNGRINNYYPKEWRIRMKKD